MPLYEYLCGSCGHRFERIQKFSDAPVTECPSCGGAVAKLPSSPAIQFKGSGWYITDYAKSGAGAGKDATKGESTDKSATAPASSTSTSSSSSTETTSTPAAAAPAKTDTK
jgi:putative FmdB family regulatory protein